jgi:protease-4
MAYANYTQKKEYYLNSVASPIYINPGIWISKDYLLSLFFKDFQENLQVPK